MLPPGIQIGSFIEGPISIWSMGIKVTFSTGAAKLSESCARTVVERYPGAIVPERLIARLAAANEPREEGISMLAELLSELARVPGVSGVAIVDVDDAEAVAEAIRRSGVLAQAGNA